MNRQEGQEFIRKCVTVATEHGGVYEDDKVKIDVQHHGMLTLEVTRKAVDDPERPHLSVENPVIMCVEEGGEKFQCIRAHGEHVVIKEHVESLFDSL